MRHDFRVRGSGFGFFDTILGFEVNSGFWFFDTILGFGVNSGFGFLTRFCGLGFWSKNKKIHPKSIIFIKKVIIWHALALQHALEIIKSSVKHIKLYCV